PQSSRGPDASSMDRSGPPTRTQIHPDYSTRLFVPHCKVDVGHRTTLPFATLTRPPAARTGARSKGRRNVPARNAGASRTRVVVAGGGGARWRGTASLPEPHREVQQEEETTASSGGTTSLPPMGPPHFWRPLLNATAAGFPASCRQAIDAA